MKSIQGQAIQLFNQKRIDKGAKSLYLTWISRNLKSAGKLRFNLIPKDYSPCL